MKIVRSVGKISCVLLGVPLLVSFLGWCVLGLFPPPQLVNKLSYSQAVYDSEGGLLRLTLTSDEKFRLWTPLDKISPSLVKATLLKEDRHFWRHCGVNPWAILRAAFSTFIAGTGRQGGSTISMQLARMRYGIYSRTVSGKFWQIYKALQLERHFSKKDILEAYLNVASYGGNIEGVGAASIIYFGKDSSSITLSEALALAVIPQRPAARSLARDSPDLLKAKLDLERLWRTQESLELPPILPVRHETRPNAILHAPHFVNRMLDAHPYDARVLSTLDRSLQQMLERQISQYVARHSDYGIKNAAALLLNYQTMEALALVGSADFLSTAIEGQVDVTRGKRSPGSTLKPFIYALAIDQGLIHPHTMLKDTKISVSAYNPENFDKDFLGPLSATDALVKSRNVPAVLLANQLQRPSFYNFLQFAQIKKLREQDFYGLSLALGGVEVTLEELVTLYAMLGNGGELKPIRFSKKDPTAGSGTRLLSPESSYLVLDMLKENPRPNFDILSVQSAKTRSVPWKTGTSFGFRDAWSVGLIGDYVLGVWIGNADGKPNSAFIGREAAGPLFFNIVDALLSDKNLHRLEPLPSAELNVKKVKVCAISGMLPGPHCRHLRESFFIPGVSPIESCSVHREIMIEPDSGLRSCSGLSHQSVPKVFEFWPSDILELYKSAGLPRQLPPAFDPRCGLESEIGRRPTITSPQSSLVYTGSVGSPLTIPLLAVTDSDSAKSYWFVDDAYLASAPRGESIIWSAVPGDHIVRVVDELGRAAAVRARVVVQ